MPVQYRIAAQIVDIRYDNPKEGDKFFVDTNVWFWMTYTRAGSSALFYQLLDYPGYVDKVLENGGHVYQSAMAFAELAHLIERAEFNIYKKNLRNQQQINSKEFRHNCTVERENVLKEIEAAWVQVKSLGEPLDAVINNSFVDSALSGKRDRKVDGYDLFNLKLMSDYNIKQIITDDGDFATIPGIRVFTSNKNVLHAARTQNMILKRGHSDDKN